MMQRDDLIAEQAEESRNPYEGRKCPRCTGPLLGQGEQRWPGLSRYDNRTKVCSPCTVEEAWLQSYGIDVPNFDYIIVDGIMDRKAGAGI